MAGCRLVSAQDSARRQLDPPVCPLGISLLACDANQPGRLRGCQASGGHTESRQGKRQWAQAGQGQQGAWMVLRGRINVSLKQDQQAQPRSR